MGKAALLGAGVFSGLAILVMTPLFYPSLHGKPRKAAEKNAHPLSLIDPREYLCKKLCNTELDALPDYLNCRSNITPSHLFLLSFSSLVLVQPGKSW